MRKFKSLDSKLPELKEGENYFCIRYTGMRVNFRTVVAAKDSTAARKYFESHYSSYAEIVSITKGTY